MRSQRYKADVKIFDTGEGPALTFALYASSPADLREKMAMVMEALTDEETEA